MKLHRNYSALIATLLLTATGFAQSEATQESEKAFRRADADLNQVYQRVMTRLKTPDAKKHLVKAQNAWISFRDSESEFRAGITGGGSAYSMDFMAKQTDLTKERIKDLRTILSRLP
jgi:uncharacterized protein YecT (DUF1311 family)